GSDCPVESISPILGIWAAVARRNPPEEGLTVGEALRTYSLNAAYSSFDEHKRGTIEAGKLADLTVLSGDLSSVQSDDIKFVKVEMTIVNGKVVYVRSHLNKKP
ncbi:MAG: amidohydrolase family protein, partial [Candidatus Bathyarchaeia archaeon]